MDRHEELLDLARIHLAACFCSASQKAQRENGKEKTSECPAGRAEQIRANQSITMINVLAARFSTDRPEELLVQSQICNQYSALFQK